MRAVSEDGLRVFRGLQPTASRAPRGGACVGLVTHPRLRSRLPGVALGVHPPPPPGRPVSVYLVFVEGRPVLAAAPEGPRLCSDGASPTGTSPLWALPSCDIG